MKLYFAYFLCVASSVLFSPGKAPVGLLLPELTFRAPAGAAGILPIFLLLLVALPFALLLLVRGGAAIFLTLSAGLWLLGQFVSPAPAVLPVMNILAWQLLFFGGVWAGSLKPTRWHEALFPMSAVVCALFFLGRHGYVGPEGLVTSTLTEKTTLAPLRLANCAALFILVAQLGKRYPSFLSAEWLSLLGRNSLWVFVGHIVLSNLATSFIGQISAMVPAAQIAGMLAVFSLLYGLAYLNDLRLQRI